jgi:hypothetical protein
MTCDVATRLWCRWQGRQIAVIDSCCTENIWGNFARWKLLWTHRDNMGYKVFGMWKCDERIVWGNLAPWIRTGEWIISSLQGICNNSSIGFIYDVKYCDSKLDTSAGTVGLLTAAIDTWIVVLWCVVGSGTFHSTRVQYWILVFGNFQETPACIKWWVTFNSKASK